MVYDFAPRFPEAQRQIAEWIREGRLKYIEEIVKGLKNAPKAFIGLFQGRSLGKQLVQVSEP
jgi:NADPH-dependent curcumin reductase CurA